MQAMATHREPTPVGELRLRAFDPADYQGPWRDPPGPVIGWTAEAATAGAGWRIVGCGGICHVAGLRFAFFNLFDEDWRRPFVVHRLARSFMQVMTSMSGEAIHAMCDKSKPDAERWLRRFGFEIAAGETMTPEIAAWAHINGTEIWICRA